MYLYFAGDTTRASKPEGYPAQLKQLRADLLKQKEEIVKLHTRDDSLRLELLQKFEGYTTKGNKNPEHKPDDTELSVGKPFPRQKVECANEWEICRCNGTVFFGAFENSKNVAAETGDKIRCSRVAFGSDPAVNVVKRCWCLAHGSAIPPQQQWWPTRLDELPGFLVDFGLSVFGSHKTFLSVIDGMDEPQEIEIGNGKVVWLVQAKTDNSVMRLMQDDILSTYGLRRMQNDGSLVVDIGANIGFVSIAAALLNPSLKIVAIEPTPSTFFYLYYNLVINSVPILNENQFSEPNAHGVCPVHAAVGDNEGTIQLMHSPSSSQDSVTGPAGVLAGNLFKRTDVRLVTVPNLLDQMSRGGTWKIQIMKMVTLLL